MSVIGIELAIQHLRAEDDDQAFVQVLLDASEGAACNFMQRRMYADDSALAVARDAALTLRAQARANYSTAMANAYLISDPESRSSAVADAECDLNRALYLAGEMTRGIIVNETIQAACLLILGHLYTNREDVVAGAGTLNAVSLPLGSQFLLGPYRINMGI